MIRSIDAAQRLDSKGIPTVQVDVTTDEGKFRALVPSGAAKGKYESSEVRDGNDDIYGGMGVETAVKNVKDVIAPVLIEKQFDPRTQLREIDECILSLDGTQYSSILGTNSLLGVSMACARAGAAAEGLPLYDFLRREANVEDEPYVLPVPFFNALNGGLHSGNTMPFQEVMVSPVGARTFEEAMRMGCELHHRLMEVVYQKFGIHVIDCLKAIGSGDEGGFSPPISHLDQGLNLVEDAVERCGYAEKTKFGIHAASPNFFNADEERYDLGFPDKVPKLLTREEMQDFYHDVTENYPVVLLEDPFGDEDEQSWIQMNKLRNIEIVGNSLLGTNPERIRLAKDAGLCNSVLLKLTHIGTISRALDIAKLSYGLGMSVFIAHRAGEATDDFIADLTIALGNGHLKSGAPYGGERIMKYNRILDIEAELKAKKKPCTYAGQNFRFSGIKN